MEIEKRMAIDLGAFEKALAAHCDDASKQMIAWTKQVSGKPPEIALPFILNPRSALQAAIEAYEAAKDASAEAIKSDATTPEIADNESSLMRTTATHQPDDRPISLEAVKGFPHVNFWRGLMGATLPEAELPDVLLSEVGNEVAKVFALLHNRLPRDVPANRDDIQVLALELGAELAIRSTKREFIQPDDLAAFLSINNFLYNEEADRAAKELCENFEITTHVEDNTRRGRDE